MRRCELRTGTVVAANGRGALDAAKGLRVGEAGDLFGQAKDAGVRFFDGAKRFNTMRTQCKDDRM